MFLSLVCMYHSSAPLTQKKNSKIETIETTKNQSFCLGSVESEESYNGSNNTFEFINYSSTVLKKVRKNPTPNSFSRIFLMIFFRYPSHVLYQKPKNTVLNEAEILSGQFYCFSLIHLQWLDH